MLSSILPENLAQAQDNPIYAQTRPVRGIGHRYGQDRKACQTPPPEKPLSSWKRACLACQKTQKERSKQETQGIEQRSQQQADPSYQQHATLQEKRPQKQKKEYHQIRMHLA